MRVLICGAGGQVGHELMRHAPAWVEAIGLDSAALDITDAQAVKRSVETIRPELIINAAAYTAVDKAESDTQRAYAVNRDGVAWLAREAERLAIPLFHISTDYVFAGDADEPYLETDATGPTGIYGHSKLAGELELAANCSRHLILRTSWVFGSHGSNFVKTMLRLGRERGELSVVADQRGCPTSANSIALALWRLADDYRQRGGLTWGCYHFSGQPACSWHGFAEEIFRQASHMGLLARAPNVKAITSAQYPNPAKRPEWSVLNCGKLSRTYGIEPADWRDELHQVLVALSG
jgi:dTDP-4-dehydrorhamnose reductase